MTHTKEELRAAWRESRKRDKFYEDLNEGLKRQQGHYAKIYNYKTRRKGDSYVDYYMEKFHECAPDFFLDRPKTKTMKLNLEIKTLTERNELIEQLNNMSFEPRLSEDLTVTKYRSGEEIIRGFSLEQFLTLGRAEIGAYFVIPGGHYLYNWHAVNSKCGLGPFGHHVPSKDEWKTLHTELESSPTYNGRLDCQLALSFTGNRGEFWSSTETMEKSAHSVRLGKYGRAKDDYDVRRFGMSVRVIED